MRRELRSRVGAGLGGGRPTSYPWGVLGRISLANKCILLFGAAVVLIIVAALGVPWVRMNEMVDDAETEVSRQMVLVWEGAIRRAAGDRAAAEPAGGDGSATPPAAAAGSAAAGEASERVPTVNPVWPDGRLGGLRAGQSLFIEGAMLAVLDQGESENPRRTWFVQRAWEALQADPDKSEYARSEWGLTTRNYYYARAVRNPGGGLEGMIVLSRNSPAAARSMWINTVALLSAGAVALGLAVLVFYLITSKIILRPVRLLRETAAEVRGGNLETRSDIRTGDEFEDLADTFNEMLGTLQSNEDQLRALNIKLDERLNELAQRNVVLYEAAKVKGEFLASVSHELRTPLNSILGFAELMEELANRDAQELGADASPEAAAKVAKRLRYVGNIMRAGRALLELINGLLEMAKVEAGKVELHVESVNLRDAAEHLIAIMRPQADKRGVELRAEFPETLPAIRTDPGRLQQVIYNLLSNAIKFTGDAAEAERARGGEAGDGAEGAGGAGGAGRVVGRPALVTLRVEHLVARGLEGASAQDKVRISVLDTGPGIAPEDQRRIFEKFTQLDGSHTRRHAGTGLGLAISKELTSLLQGEIQVDSQLGRGSMFSVILPLTLEPPARPATAGASASAPGGGTCPAASGAAATPAPVGLVVSSR